MMAITTNNSISVKALARFRQCRSGCFGVGFKVFIPSTAVLGSPQHVSNWINVIWRPALSTPKIGP